MSAEPEKRLGQVAWEALGHVERWRTVPLLMGGQQYAVMAAAVEAEVLRRAVAHLRVMEQGLFTAEERAAPIPAVVAYHIAVAALEGYAKQQRGGQGR